jgi:pimeloyl-ACP methyl ester carboxylesterase
MSHLGETDSRIEKRPQSHSIGVGQIVSMVMVVLGRILALLAAVLLCLPVVLLPSATSVPMLVWVLLTIADVALLIMQFRIAPTWLGITASPVGVMVVSLVAIAASQVFASTPPIADAHELTLYLRRRFGQAKVYVLGESWGSVLGIWLVQRYPELFHAFIGTGQMVAFKENDLLCYEFALRWAQERGDIQKVEQLKRLGPPPYYGEGVAQKEATFLLDTYEYMNQNPAIVRAGNTLRDMAGQEYGLYDKLNYVRGALDTLNVVYPQLWEVDLRQQAARLEVPVYFLKGRHDVNAPPVLTEEYYRILTAPHKELVWFERSGHNPWISEPARFVDVIVNTVLAQTSPAR